MFPWLSVPVNRMVRNSTLASDWDYLVRSAESLVKKRREEGGNEKVGTSCLAIESLP